MSTTVPALDPVPMPSPQEQRLWSRWRSAHMQACLYEAYKDLWFALLNPPTLNINQEANAEYHRISRYNDRVTRFLEHINRIYGHTLRHLVSEMPMGSLSDTPGKSLYRSHEGHGIVGWVFGCNPMTGGDTGRDAPANYALLNSCLRRIPKHLMRLVVLGFGLYDPEHFSPQWNKYPRLFPGEVIEVGVEPGAELHELAFVDSARALSYILPCLSFVTPPPHISLIVLDNDRSFLTNEFAKLFTWITDPDSMLLHHDRGMQRKIWRQGEVHVTSKDEPHICTMSFILELHASRGKTGSDSWARIKFVTHFQGLDRHRLAKFVDAFDSFLPSLRTDSQRIEHGGQ
ncbi:unnamed protein product [Peniophora sp. CBMAI 1063]|nr:unnamed protein product [Peniophora sp. CBMAI 1063]